MVWAGEKESLALHLSMTVTVQNLEIGCTLINKDNLN